MYRTRGEHPPDLVGALLDRRARRALRHVVLGVSTGGGDAPALSADGADVVPGNVVLKVDAVLLVCEQKSAGRRWGGGEGRSG